MKAKATTIPSPRWLPFWLSLVLAQNAKCAWPLDPHVNLPICTATNDQQYPQLTTDGQGGAIICWTDWRLGYLNRVPEPKGRHLIALFFAPLREP